MMKPRLAGKVRVDRRSVPSHVMPRDSLRFTSIAYQPQAIPSHYITSCHATVLRAMGLQSLRTAQRIGSYADPPARGVSRDT